MKAYGTLIAVCFVAGVVIRLFGLPFEGRASYLPVGSLPGYWTSMTPSAFVTSVAAGIAGAILIATNRAILTGGVMIALALIPAAALIGLGAALGEWTVAFSGFLRLTAEAAIVVLCSLGVFGWKRLHIHKRAMMYS